MIGIEVENSNSNADSNNDIAIIGFGLRFPGDSNDLDQFWESLINKVDAITDIDPERCNHSFYHNGEMTTVKFGQVNDWKNFDPLFFGIPPKDVHSMDPQQRLLLKVAWETFEDAGIDPLSMRGQIVNTNTNSERQFLIPFTANSKYSLDQYLSSVIKKNGDIQFLDFVKHQVYSRTHQLIQRSVVIAKDWNEFINAAEVTSEQFNTKQPEFNYSYIYENMKEPVKFQQSIENIYKYIQQQQTSNNNITFIEVSPHPTLSYYVKQSSANHPSFNVTVMNPLNKKSGVDEQQQFRKTISTLFCNGLSTIDFQSQFNDQEKRDTSYKARNTSLPPNEWKKVCIGRVSIFPHSQTRVESKEDMDYLLNKCQYYTTANSNEIYRSLKMNSKMTFGPSFKLMSEVKLSQDFILGKIDIQNLKTSVFDENSFFNPSLFDVHLIVLLQQFPDGCVIQGLEDFRYYSSNIPKKRSDCKMVYVKVGYMKPEHDIFVNSYQVFLEDGTKLFDITKCKIASLKEKDMTPIKHPNNNIYSSFWQPKECENSLQHRQIQEQFGNFKSICHTFLSKPFLPFAIKLLFKSIQERAKFIRKDMVSQLSIEELESKYFKVDQKWKYLFRFVFKFLKENIELIVDEESDIESVITQTKLIYPGIFEALYFEKSIPMIAGLLFGEPDEVFAQTLLTDGTMHAFYNSMIFDDYLKFLADTVSQSIKPLIQRNEKRIIRILEIGSGTGTQTRYILEELERLIGSCESSNIEIEFTFTDISTSFFVEAKQLFDKFNSININIVYRVVDVSKDFQSQDINIGYYDMVVMFLVLHVTSHIETSLQNIYKSLKPGGSLLFVEVNKNSPFNDLIIGFMDQWWGFKDYELRPDHCCLDPDTWKLVLKNTGFENTVMTSTSNDCIINHFLIMAQKPNINQLSITYQPSISKYNQCFIYSSPNNQFSTKLQSHFNTISQSTKIINNINEFKEISSTITSSDIIIFTLGIEQQTIENFTTIDMEYTTINQYLLSKKLSTKHILLTMNAQIESSNYLSSSLTGIFRSFCEFNELQLYCVDIDSGDHQQQIQTIEYICNSNHFIENEFSIRNNQVMVENWRKEISQATINKSSSFEKNNLGYRLDVNLEPKLKPFNSKLQSKQILVRVKSLGLNFRDTLIHRGIVHHSGIEFSGEIVAAHDSVKKFKVGDQGELRLIPMKEFSMKQVKNAYNYMIERKNIGKIVISDLDDTILDQSIKSYDKQLLKKDYSINTNSLGKTVLITGQSGVALETIKWIVSNSTESINLIVLSQSEIKFELEFIQNQLLSSKGSSRIYFRQVDVSKIDSIRSAIKEICNDKAIGPIESIFHFAFQLHDCLPEDITLEKYNNGHSGKTIGALNLHQLSLELNWNLKNFILCSSIATTLGSPFQCPYMSSNSVINSLSKYRRSIGLPCTTIIWGALSIGNIHESEMIANKFESIGYKMFSIQKVIGAMDLMSDLQEYQTVMN
eukprot:gene7546-9278_t